MIRQFISMYLPSYPKVLIYMLQSSDYKAKPYLKWLHRTKDFRSVMQRRDLDRTRSARILLLALRLGITLQLLAGLLLIYLGIWNNLAGGVVFGIAVILSYPLTWAYLLVLALALGRISFELPAEKQAIRQSVAEFANHPGIKIAVAGSYGKTTMKEMLNTVLRQGLKVAATPANKNVSRSHAQFAKKLKGNEEVLIIEYGEGAPGDVARFAATTQPTHAVITGLAPAHLDQYKTLAAAGEDIFSLATYLKGKNVYVNNDSPEVKPFLKESYQLFDHSGALGWKTSKVRITLHGTSFTLDKGKKSLRLHSSLLGEHHVGYLSLVAALGLQLGLSEQQVIDGIAATKPFEHRMQPYQLSGAWIIDDTYNGNLEGIAAGTQLLSDLDAKRKLYVTPGLVDQGDETEAVHNKVGHLIAKAQPDVVVLMRNSVTDFIKAGLKEGKYSGELRVEDNPLEFYTNLSHFVATGDLVVMQNDWTDNYA
jgi:UDP-N-acetylmuramoyl-tripeptide--D-alanyl-D-alanine ligase